MTPSDPPVGGPHVVVDGAARRQHLTLDAAPLGLDKDVAELGLDGRGVETDLPRVGSETVVTACAGPLDEAEAS